MNVEKINDFVLDDFVLISSLPDMGKVGGIVSKHLTKELETKEALKIILSDKPWINQKNGIIDVPHDEYTISVNKEKTDVIFTGENQPQEANTVDWLSFRQASALPIISVTQLVLEEAQFRLSTKPFRGVPLIFYRNGETQRRYHFEGD